MEIARSVGEDGIECVLEFDSETAVYKVTARKGDIELEDSFKASWPNPIFGPDMFDIAEAEDRIEKLCKKINDAESVDN